jgi:FO synthase
MASDTTDSLRIIEAAVAGYRPGADAARRLVDAPLEALLSAAELLTLAGFGRRVSYSRKVFIPLTELCRDVCHYCTFAKIPRRVSEPYLSGDAVLAIARAGEASGCKEALFTLGDQPEKRYSTARRALAARGVATTLELLEHMAQLVLSETTLLPHLNPGVMTGADLKRLRPVSVSMGLMLETTAERLAARGNPHFGSPDKRPAARLATLRAAGECAVPFTTGLLIGIGETRLERIDALLALRDLHVEFGHLQELILQNFCPKPGTRMALAPEPSLEEHVWTIAVARLLFGPEMSLQAPPNLRPGWLAALIRAGINDWGGVSPVTPDHVNPEAPWPELAALAEQTAAAGRELHERLALTPAYARDPARWLDAALVSRVLRMTDAAGLARDGWCAGSAMAVTRESTSWDSERPGTWGVSREVGAIVGSLRDGHTPGEEALVRLFGVDDCDLRAVLTAADQVRAETVGDTVTYVVNRNINYTNICMYRCGFCAFSKGRSAHDLRGPAYDLDLDEIALRAAEASAAGATEVCLQGGIHPRYTGETYLEIVAAVKAAAPTLHVHAFSPLEIWHGAGTLGLPLQDYLARLREAGLATLPGTAAEILDDEVRDIICPDKIRTHQWLEVMRAAHAVGLRSTATIMFGHVDRPVHWAKHLLRIRALQAQTGGFTEFVPLPFVHMEAPLWRKGRARSGPTLREALLMHAVARLALHPLISNVQTSWVKMGRQGAALCLKAGANDLGGTLMNESITRAAGGVNGQLLERAEIVALARSIARPAAQRTTLYGRVCPGAAAGAVSCAASLRVSGDAIAATARVAAPAAMLPT